MTKIVTRMMAGAAALGLVAAPIMARANTRAGDSAASYSTGNALPGLGRSNDGEGQEEGGGFTALVIGGLAVAAIVAGIITAADSGAEDDASPGT